MDGEWLHRFLSIGPVGGPQSWVGPAVTAAVISALVTVIGYWLGFLISRKLDAYRRREKTVDFTKAIGAEIQSNLDRHSNIDLDQHLADILAKFEPPNLPAGTTSAYTPFVPKRVSTIIFDALISEIYVLPTSVIDVVVLYYESEHMVLRLIEDMRDPTFGLKSQAVKAAIYSDYIDIIKRTYDLGQKAQKSISTVLSALTSNNQASDQP